MGFLARVSLPPFLFGEKKEIFAMNLGIQPQWGLQLDVEFPSFFMRRKVNLCAVFPRHFDLIMRDAKWLKTHDQNMIQWLCSANIFGGLHNLSQASFDTFPPPPPLSYLIFTGQQPFWVFPHYSAIFLQNNNPTDVYLLSSRLPI